MFTSDPATADGSPPEFIPRVGAAELLAMNLNVLPIDALVLELMAHAKHQKEIQIVKRGHAGQHPEGPAGRACGHDHPRGLIS